MNELDSDEKIRVDDMSRLSCIPKRRGLLSMRLQSTVVWHSVYSGLRIIGYPLPEMSPWLYCINFQFSYRSNFFDSQSYELRFSVFFHRYLIHSFPVSFMFSGDPDDTLPHVFEIIIFSSFFAFLKNIVFTNGDGYPLQRWAKHKRPRKSTN